MKAAKPTWTRDTSGLERSARQRSEAARQRVSEALQRLLRDPSQRLNFNTVAAAAGVTPAYLYKEPTLRERIDRLREGQAETRRRLESLRERTEESSRVLLLAKDRRIRDLEARVKRLEAELATCRARLYDQL
jgi:Family of unknown function (DUF6262)